MPIRSRRPGRRPGMVSCLSLALLVHLHARLPAQIEGAKAPVPAEDAQARALAVIKDTFKAEYAGRSRDDRRNLARLLVDRGAATKDDLAACFVMLNEASGIAARAGDGLTASLAAGEISKRFEVNALQFRWSVLAETARFTTEPADAEALSRAALEFAEHAILEVQYETATKAAQLAASQAGNARNSIQPARAREWLERVRSAGAEHQRIKPAIAVLSERPDDPDANDKLGQFLCYFKGQWEKGLPHLAKGLDARFKMIVQLEQAGASAAQDQVRLAEAYFELAEASRNTVAKSALQTRSLHWYEKALPQLEGLTRTRAGPQVAYLRQATNPNLKLVQVRFSTLAALNRFVTIQGKWEVKGGELLGTGPSNIAKAIDEHSFRSISRVVLRGRIALPGKCNLRLAAGPVSLIFNWERAGENPFRTNGNLTVTSPHALVPGKEHEIELIQTGPRVQLLLDSRVLYQSEAALWGTVAVWPAEGSTIAIRELSILGVVDPSVKVTKPSHEIW